MNVVLSRGWAILTLGLGLFGLHCEDRDVSQIIGANLPDASTSGGSAGAAALALCVPGQTLACEGECGSGYQVCANDGLSYAACRCPLSPENNPYISIYPDGVLGLGTQGSPIRWPRPGDMTPGGGPTVRGIVGAACSDNQDCRGGLGCLTTSATALAGGGPAGGYCTLDCDVPETCSGIDPLSTCATLGGQRMCIRLCLAGETADGERKCLARSDLTCVSVEALGGEPDESAERQVGICAPQCRDDASCEGRRCDLSRGICTDTPRPGDPVGAGCDSPEACAGGICLGLSDDTERVCSAFCTLGVTGCGFAEGETPGAACLLPQIRDESTGDRGLCVEVCDTPADCSEPGSECVPQNGGPRAGICLRLATGVPPVTPAPDAGPTGTSGIVGAACSVNDDCEGGLRCLASSSTELAGGGPAGGYCTLDCDAPEDCSAIDPLSSCATIAGRRTCVRLCLSQDSIEGEQKCLNRSDLTCLSLAALGQEAPTGQSQIGICAPQCQSDSSCDGRSCDLSRGLCNDTPRPGEPVGAACASAAECAGGICVGLSPQTARFCSAFCTLGVAGCGFAEGETPGAACLFSQIPDEGTGDRGLCIDVCDSADDCLEPGSECVPQSGGPRAGICLRSSAPVPPDDDPPVIDPPDDDPPVTDPPDDDPPVIDPPDDDPPDAGPPVITPPDSDPPDAGSPEPEPEPATSVGLPCDDDADCGDGSCLASVDDPFGVEGGPAGGYCSFACDQSADCEAGSLCVPLPSGGFCHRRCSPDDQDACLGRDTLVCNVSSGVDNGFCQPRCNTDADCGERVCDARNRLCVDPPDPSPAVPAGAACSVDADCPGDVCLPNAASAFCSGVCLLNTARGCEDYGANAFCLLPLPNNPPLGLCLGLCNTPSDCPVPSFECVPIGGTINGRTGACLPPLPE